MLNTAPVLLGTSVACPTILSPLFYKILLAFLLFNIKVLERNVNSESMTIYIHIFFYLNQQINDYFKFTDALEEKIITSYKKL